MSTNLKTIRKRNSKNKETPEECRSRLNRENERKRQKRASETIEKREERLRNNRERQSKEETPKHLKNGRIGLTEITIEGAKFEGNEPKQMTKQYYEIAGT